MTGRQIVFCIVTCVTIICITIVICVSTVVSTQEREEQRFTVHVPELSGH